VATPPTAGAPDTAGTAQKDSALNPAAADATPAADAVADDAEAADAADVAATADAAGAPAAITRGLPPAGPFTSRQLFRIDEALRAADRETGLTFSVYVGELDEPSRDHAEALLDQLAEPGESVLVAVSPNQRILEIVTGEHAGRRLPDRLCALAALSMTAAFGGGDLAGGVVTGLRMLADQARVG
jgi:hypothetical protein